jgi:hypothetical protein
VEKICHDSDRLHLKACARWGSSSVMPHGGRMRAGGGGGGGPPRKWS